MGTSVVHQAPELISLSFREGRDGSSLPEGLRFSDYSFQKMAEKRIFESKLFIGMAISEHMPVAAWIGEILLWKFPMRL
jgi:hypothetical protein